MEKMGTIEIYYFYNNERDYDYAVKMSCRTCIEYWLLLTGEKDDLGCCSYFFDCPA